MKKKLILLLSFFLLILGIPFLTYLIAPPKGSEEAAAEAAVARISNTAVTAAQPAAGLPSAAGETALHASSTSGTESTESTADTETVEIAQIDTLQTAAGNRTVSVAQVETEKTAASGTAAPEARVFRLYDDSVEKVIEVTEEEFLIGALACEMSPKTNIEALKAQTVASYTHYSLLRQAQRVDPTEKHGADFAVNSLAWLYYTTKDQMKIAWGKDYKKYYEKLQTAVRDVAGETLRYGGELITASYFPISSGQTENSADIWGSAYPYLTAVASPWDKYADGYKTTETVTAAAFAEMVQGTYPKCKFPEDPKKWVGEVQRTDSGSVQTIVIGGQPLAGVEVRNLFSLRSSNFTIAYKNGNFTFTVLGYGHGVGMSQNGAAAMAKQGSTYDKILRWYYPGASLTA